MKHRFFCLFLLLALLLSGCACEHEWVDVDCLNPQICAKCQETTGEALGHSWVEATCDAPKTCSRCGQTEGAALSHDWTAATCVAPATCLRCGLTEGQPLGHDYDIWFASGDTMTHHCLTCGEGETVPYDGFAYCQSNLVGAWDFTSINGYPASEFGAIFYLQLSKDSSFFGRINGSTIVKGNWSLGETPYANGYPVYLEYNGENADGVFDPETDELIIWNAHEGTYFSIYFDRGNDAGGALLGVWSGEADGNTYSFTLNYDRSFYATLDTTFHGTWTILPETSMRSKTTGELSDISILELMPDESYGLKDSFVYISPSADGDYAEPTFVQWFSDSGEKVEFRRSSDILSEEDIQSALDPLEAAALVSTFQKDALGIWCGGSSFPQSLLDTAGADGSLDMTHYAGSDSDFFLIFQENGSFSGCLGEKVSGIWAVDKDVLHQQTYVTTLDGTLSFSDGRTPLEFTLVKNSECVYMTVQWDREPSLLTKYTVDGLKTLNQGRDFLSGTWKTCSYGLIVNNTAEPQPVADWHLTLQSDGTLSGHLLDKDVSGTWTYEGYSADFDCFSATFVIDGQSISAGSNAEYPGLSFSLMGEDGKMYDFYIER